MRQIMAGSERTIRRIQFTEAGKFNTTFRQLQDQVANKVVRETAAVFSENMERVLSLWELPMNLATWLAQMRATQADSLRARQGTVIRTGPPPSPDETEEDRQNRKRIEEFNEMWQKYPNDVDFGTPELNQVFQTMLGPIQDASVEKTIRGSDSLLAAMLVGSWTAFEALATDLWVTAVNQRPMSLGVGALRAPKRERSSSAGKETAETDKYTPMNLDILRQYRFNLGDCLGTMIKQKRKFDFNSLDGIQHAYCEAFSFTDKKGTRRAPPGEVKKWFSGTDHDQLMILESLRHVLVHQGGRVDRAFLDRVGGKCQTFSTLREGERIELNGVMTRDFTAVAVRRGIVLITGVDEWLKKPQ
jgi:hypothetical protein